MKTRIEPTAATQSPLERLRRELDAAERGIVRLEETPASALDVIRQLDTIDQLLQGLAGPEYDTRPEQVRADALHERALREARRFTALIAGRGQAAQLTNSPNWQAIAAEARAQRQRAQRRLLLISSSAIIVVLLLFVVLPRLFPPTPQADTEAVARLASAGDISGAIARAREEQAAAPDDPSILVWLGVLHEVQGDLPAAEAAWAGARQSFGDEGEFYFERALAYLQLGNPQAAEADALRLIELPGRAAAGHLLLGDAYDEQGRVDEALASFEEAVRIAEETDQPELVVIAKTRIAGLSQRIEGFPTPAP